MRSSPDFPVSIAFSLAGRPRLPPVLLASFFGLLTSNCSSGITHPNFAASAITSSFRRPFFCITFPNKIGDFPSGERHASPCSTRSAMSPYFGFPSPACFAHVVQYFSFASRLHCVYSPPSKDTPPHNPSITFTKGRIIFGFSIFVFFEDFFGFNTFSASR